MKLGCDEILDDLQPSPFDELRAGSAGLVLLRTTTQHCVLG
jgi:hypothetical protein